MIGQRLRPSSPIAVVPAIECGAWDAELVQRALGRQMRLLDQLDDLGLLGRRISHASSSPSPLILFLSRRFSRVRSATTSFNALASRRRSLTSPDVAARAVHRPTGACRPPGTPWTSRNTSRRRCPRGGRARRCSPRRATPPARCGFSLPQNTAGASDAECPSALVLPALWPARISVSSSLLAATMNQKSSLREVPQFVSGVLTANSLDRKFKRSCRRAAEPAKVERVPP